MTSSSSFARSEPEHAPVFALDRPAEAPAPNKLSVIVGFRREYAADWLDFEQTRGFRAEQVPVNLLAPRTASDALITLASEAGFTLEQELVENFITSVQHQQGVSPVDVSHSIVKAVHEWLKQDRRYLRDGDSENRPHLRPGVRNQSSIWKM